MFLESLSQLWNTPLGLEWDVSELEHFSLVSLVQFNWQAKFKCLLFLELKEIFETTLYTDTKKLTAWFSIRANITFNICVRVALAVV